MNIEQKMNYQLNKYPAVKKTIKRAYQLGMYAVSKKIKSEGDITRISPDDADHEYFFGYYDKSPWDATDRYMLCMRAKDTWSDVSPREKADILLIDTEMSESNPDRVRKIAETRAWNVQQACMLQWLGPDFSSRVLYNDYRDGQYVSVILTLSTMEEKVIPAAVYFVSADGRFALTLDFSRLYNLRPGYGYYNVPEKTKGIGLPDTTAIWRVDLETGEVTDTLKYTDFANFQPRPEMQEKGSVHKVNHIMLSPNGKRFMVLYRWFNGQRKYTRLITCNVDGTDMYVLSDDDMVSHCFWKNDNEIIAFENKKHGGTGYYLMRDKTEKYYHCWKGMTGDGHPSFSPDRKLIVTDTYPDRARIQYIKVMNGDVRKTEVNVFAKVFAPFKYDNDTRCDLHPRWNHKGDKICFDSVFEGHRGMYYVDLNSREFEITNLNSKTKVLYILDSLKQRFGVTAVAMNYFRNIDRNRIQINFLVFNDSESEIVDEIRRAGSDVFFMPKLSAKNVFDVIKFYNSFFKEHNDYKIIHSHFNQIDSIVFPIAKKNGIKHCISHSHNTKYSDYRLRAIRNWVMCIPLKKAADTWAACGVNAGEFLYGKNFMKSQKHLVINNAIDIDRFRFNVEVRELKRKELGFTSEFVIGNVGSLKLQKNQQYLLKLFARLLEVVKNPNDYRLIIVGDGDLKKNLVKLADELKISDYVTFMGVRNDVNVLLQVMDVFILPSLYEGLPVIGIEAQASGIPCLFSSNITREVDICNARFIELEDDKDKWVDAIIQARSFKRIDSVDMIREKGFSIKDEAIKLSDFYVNL